MSPVLWALCPILLTVLAWAVVAWRGRSRRRASGTFESVLEHRRFLAALAASTGKDRDGGRWP